MPSLWSRFSAGHSFQNLDSRHPTRRVNSSKSSAAAGCESLTRGPHAKRMPRIGSDADGVVAAEGKPRDNIEGMAMLVLSRKKNESIVINNDITIVVVEIRGDKVRLGVEAPKEVPVHRQEVLDALKRPAAPNSPEPRT